MGKMVMDSTTDINLLEGQVAAYLRNPLRHWKRGTVPYITTSGKLQRYYDLCLASRGYFVRTPDAVRDDESVLLEVDVEAVFYDTVRSFTGTNIVGKNYDLYLRDYVRSGSTEDLPDQALKSVTDDICSFMLESDRLPILRESVAIRVATNLQQTDSFIIEDREDYSSISLYEIGDELSREFPYLFNFVTIDPPSANTLRKIDNNVSKVHGFKVKVTGDGDDYFGILFTIEDRLIEEIHWGVLNPNNARVHRVDLNYDNDKLVITDHDGQRHTDGVRYSYEDTILNLLPALVYPILRNTRYTFILPDDVGRELRNEILFSVSSPT